MRYKPLLLALLLCFTAPTYAAKDAPKEKTAAVKKSAGKKAEVAKDKKAAESKSAKSKMSESKKSAAKADAKSKKSSAKADKNDTDSRKKDADDKRSTHKKTDKKDKTESSKASAKKPAEKNTSSKKTANKSDNLDKKAENKKAAVKKADDKKEDKKDNAKTDAYKSSDSNELRAAVSAATNDLEEKKVLLKRTEGMLVRVSANLKELQQTRSRLSHINRQQRDAWDKFQKLNGDLNRLKTEVSNTRAQISRFVSGNYKNSQPNAVALFLKNAEPGQKTRFLRYTRYINSANEQVVKDLAKQQKALAAQESRINAELGRLKKLQASAQASLKKQGVKNTAEQVESRRQNAQMAKEAKKVVNQKDSEQRLNNLLSDIDKRKAEARKKEAEARKKAAEARLAAAEKARKAQARKEAEEKAVAERAALSNLTDEDLKLQAPKSGSFVTVSNPNSFSRMQGRLKKPVNGLLGGLFGQPRDGGDVWKGVFYQTAPAPVSSIAAGNVVYADELAGYGKVVVIDHGDNYVSVYSGLSDISVANGYAVGAGNKIGTSGSLPTGEEGLYLEIRYNGQNMNPLSWVN